jgi:hypothetical protein
MSILDVEHLLCSICADNEGVHTVADNETWSARVPADRCHECEEDQHFLWPAEGTGDCSDCIDAYHERDDYADDCPCDGCVEDRENRCGICEGDLNYCACCSECENTEDCCTCDEDQEGETPAVTPGPAETLSPASLDVRVYPHIILEWIEKERSSNEEAMRKLVEYDKVHGTSQVVSGCRCPACFQVRRATLAKKGPAPVMVVKPTPAVQAILQAQEYPTAVDVGGVTFDLPAGARVEE